jgi:hypothetical protein
MASTDVKYRVKVALDATSPPSSNEFVIWNSTDGNFSLTGSNVGGGVIVGPPLGITPVGTEQFFVFSQVQDGTETTLSGSDAFVYKGIADSSDVIRETEIIAQSGSDGDPLQMFVTSVPHRHQSEIEEAPNSTFYSYPGYSPVGNTVEHLIMTRSGDLSVGTKSSFITIYQNPLGTGGYIGSSSFKQDENSCISGSYNYLKIEHVAFTLNATRMQECTYHFGWYRDNSTKNALNLRCSAVENLRTPNNELIIDPQRTTGSFDGDGNFKLSLYHFSVDYVQHTFKYTLI